MPGKCITRHQESLYMSKRNEAEAKPLLAQATISERSGRRIAKGENTSTPGERHWRSREDPLEEDLAKGISTSVRERSTAHRLNALGISGRCNMPGNFRTVPSTLQCHVNHWKAPTE
ncbi:MAG: hypothetical protein PHE96_08325 [Methylococcales bacterium]|nr:hypothetical protein [Methylococcales bacterium]